MRDDYLLPSQTARDIYRQVRDLPIYDYHCHLSPKEIWEDKPFTDIGSLWLGGDHYKWRLMRFAGIPEEQITGSADPHQKFLAYAKAISLAAGNPLYYWTKMELSLYFGIEKPLEPDTAEEIWQTANQRIAREQLSPRKMIARADVRFIATTDDPADPLTYHEKLQAEPPERLRARVTPSFRTDNVLNIRRAGYAGYVARLAQTAGMEIRDLDTLQAALLKRMDDFCALGCRFSDVGIPDFPQKEGSVADADAAFRAALQGETVSDAGYDAFLFQMYRFLGAAYQKRGLVMQWHLAPLRNLNTRLYAQCGPDCGGDSVGDVLPVSRVAAMLDILHRADALPRTILYTLNPVMNAQLCAAAGCFPGVNLGAAWWFNDHKRGIREVLETIAEMHHLGAFLGMLTDSRSFLSYARHDYFRRILCTFLAELVDSGEFEGDAVAVARRVSCENIQDLLEG